MTKQTGIQQSYVASAISAGGTSSPVKNISGFNANWAVCIGQVGEETAEIMVISGVPAGTTLNFGTSPSHTGGTFLFAHALDTPIYQIHYDQVIFYRSTAGTAGPFSALATVSIQPDSLYTQYNDTTGASGYAYYGQYYNSVSGDLSGSSSISIPGGPTFYSLQKLKQRTKDKLYSAGFIRNDDIVTDWINEWLESWTNAAIKVNQNYLLGTAQYSFGTSGLGTITAIDFKQIVKAEISYDNGVTFVPGNYTSVRNYSELDFFDINYPKYSLIGETEFEALPHNVAGLFKITYAQRFTPLVNDSDELPQSLKAYTTACTEYCLGVAYSLDQKMDDAQLHYSISDKGKADFIAEITPRDVSKGEVIDIVESVSGLEESTVSEYSDYVW